MKKRGVIRWITFLAAGALAACAWAGLLTGQLRAARRQLTGQYSRAFGELVSAVADMDTALQKSRYLTAPGLQAQVCAEIYGKALSAEMALGVLPLAAQELEQTAAFLNQVGDYAAVLARTAAAGETLSEEARAQLGQLAAASGTVCGALTALAEGLGDGSVTLETLDEAAEAAVPSLGDGLLDMEQQFPEVPSLVYDGPFSAHRETAEPLGLAGLAEVSREEGLSLAAAWLGVSENRLSWLGESLGRVPLWQYALRLDSGEAYVSVTKAGGRLYAYLDPTADTTAALDRQDAAACAAHYLTRLGFTDMAETYAVARDDRLTVSFAWRQGEVLCYSDLVKVTVSLADGSLRAVESQGYWSCHCRRELPALTAPAEEYTPCPGLAVLSRQWALIPTPGGGEVLCRECKCEAEDGSHCLIYTRADTGRQERILLLLEDESGTLAK